MADRYDHLAIERKWQKRWQADKIFSVGNDSHPSGASRHLPSGRGGGSEYVLDMFPYPSGDGLHVGHPEGYTATDIYCRYLRMNGTKVLHPMGWDAFGLPAENYAIKQGTHPAAVTAKNIATFKRQIQSLGFSYDWDREVNTTDPAYYKWTQWIFLQLYKRGLAYEKEAPIWWCPKDKTGLANEEVVNGKCDRCGTTVEKKMLKQWMLKITAYADRLLEGLDRLEWPEGIKTLQRNWIGKSEGAEVKFDIVGKRYVFLHGYTSGSDKHWFPWIKSKLEKRGAEVIVPDLPNPGDPIVADQVKKVLQEVTFDENTIVVGHSLGGVVALKVLEHLKHPIKKLLLVSSYLENDFLNNEPFEKYAFDWKFDVPKIRDHVGQLLILRETTDEIVPPWQAEKLQQTFGGTIIDFAGTAPHAWGTQEPGVLKNCFDSVTVFTTRPDTLFGATYLVLSPEHELVPQITTPKQKKAVEKYVKSVAAKSDLERTSLEKEKTGVFTGAYAINPVNNEKIPVWIADYVLSGYGTGAIMAVPAHDERDFAFAKKFKLPIVKVIQPPPVLSGREKIFAPPVITTGAAGFLHADIQSDCWTGEGTMMNSGQFDGLSSEEARRLIVNKLTIDSAAKATIQYKLRDWVFSRQRYWGEPIPLVHCEKCGVVPVPEDQLPLELPNVDKYEPTGTGESPLAAIKEWVNTTCPQCGGAAKRETNTMPQWAGSCWYYLRFCDSNNDKEFASAEALKSWLPVDLYVGGAEHAVLHLLYARFWHKVLFDAGYIPPVVGDEPFKKLKNQGLILGPDGEKMSKSRGNVINPDEIVEKYGADTLRMYEMFMGPFEDAKPWDTNGILGVRRFLDKVWRIGSSLDGNLVSSLVIGDESRMHRYIKLVSEGIDNFRFNTCISDFMKWANEWSAGGVAKEEFGVFLQLLSPFAPHMVEELWSQLGHQTMVAQERWPTFDPKKIVEASITIAIQVMGKLRGTLTMPTGSDQAAVEAAAKAEPNVAKYLTGEPKKTIFVKDKLINFVI